MLRRFRVTASILSKYYHTLRYLRLSQTLGRVAYRLRSRFFPTRLGRAPSHLVNHLSSRSFCIHHPWNDSASLEQGRFTFLNRTATLGFPPDWEASELPLLWRFNLHYFEYLALLSPQLRLELCRNWTARCPFGHPLAWHPYPISLRVTNWIKAGVLEDEVLLESLYQQIYFLRRNLETFILGNHLLENIKALLMGWYIFRGQGESDEWRDVGLRLLRREIPEQVLSDGGYFERSPMYHALVLEGLLDLVNLAPELLEEEPWLLQYLRLMVDFAGSLHHPDGSLVLFNDATQEVALTPNQLASYSKQVLGYEPSLTSAFPESGFFVTRSEPFYLVVDGGPIGPDYLPGHAHADIFSYELSVLGQKVVVDTGVFEYAAGKMRDLVRSTAAHNTVTVDGVDQAECWSSFRVARRFPPEAVQFQETSEGSIFRGRFSGYRHLIGDDIVHQREIQTESGKVVVRDVVSGHGRHQVESRIHLHPNVRASHQDDHHIELVWDGGSVTLAASTPILMEDAVYCPRFGERYDCRVAILRVNRELPTATDYRILA